MNGSTSGYGGSAIAGLPGSELQVRRADGRWQVLQHFDPL